MNAKKITINIILIIGLVFAIIGLYWLSRLQIEAGNAYLMLFIIGIVFIATAIIVRLSGVNFWLEIPISKNAERGLLMLILGMLSIGALFFISTITNTQIYSPFVMAPLAFGGQLSVGAETFASLQAATSPFWTFFISCISAPVIEEIVLGFAFVAMGSLVLGYDLRSLLKIDLGENNKYFDFVGAMIFSIVMFMVLHVFNSTYLLADGSWNWSMFGYAAGFRFILNIMIYKLGNAGLLFSIGVHAVNNAVFIGGVTILAALTAFPGGIILSAIFILLIIYVFMSIKEIIKEGKEVGKDFVTFD